VVVTGWWRRLDSTPMPTPWRFAVHIGACVVFVMVIFVRGGPNPAETDAHAITSPTTAISHGDLRAAERQTVIPNPPGYPLLMSPLVLAFRPWIGAPRWCDNKPIPAILQKPEAAFFRSILMPCADQHPARGRPLPIWYRSQAVLAFLAWIVLAVGAVMLLRAAGAGRGVGEAVLVFGLAALPAASDAIAWTFHPQDLMSTGLACAGLAQALRRRWVLVGVLFAVAFLCKQFAILPLIAVVAASPTWRTRVATLLPWAGVVALGVLPFYVMAPVDTVHALTAVYVAGVKIVRTPTMVGVLGIDERLKIQIARDAPLVLSAGLALWAWWRARSRLLTGPALVGLALACLATRLVFEVGILNYYFLAVGVALLLVDLTSRRPPVLSAAWIIATRYGLPWMVPHSAAGLTAAVFLVLALVAVGLGLAQVPARGRDSPSVFRPGES
jgi:hypothetical protein